MGNLVQMFLFRTTTSRPFISSDEELGLLDLPITTIDGKKTKLRELTKGYKLTLIVNVASR